MHLKHAQDLDGISEETTNRLRSSEVDTTYGTRISSLDEQLALGACNYGQKTVEASRMRAARSVVEISRRRRGESKLSRYPFLSAVSQLLAETDPFYSESTCRERRRRFRRVYEIICDLYEQDAVSTRNPVKMTEQDVAAFVAYCRGYLDDTTSQHYLKFLGDVLQSVGNGVVARVRLKRGNLVPHVIPKSIRTIPPASFNALLANEYCLEDPWWDAIGKTAIALYSHTAMRPSELRLARLSDLDVSRMEIIVGNPKGRHRWAGAEERSPIMPGIERLLQVYLEIRESSLSKIGADPQTVEPLFPFVSVDGKVGYWSQAMWAKLKQQIEYVSGVHFRWKDFRPTFAQKAKDEGAPIEAVSKCLRHTSTRTTETYYARIRSETAFSQVRQVWEAPVVGIQFRKIEN